MPLTRFGPAGSAQSFTAMGYKHTLEMPLYLEQFGLNAFEYQCGRGVRISQEAAAKLGAAAREKDILLSLHAPYYISMSGVEEEKRLASVDYILQSARAVNAMGGTRIVIHSGSCSKMSREAALELACDTMKKALAALDAEGLSHIRPCPEVMGKINQLGTLEEVLALCRLDERILPCIDFGHLNARTFGSLQAPADFEAVFCAVENALGLSRLRELHAHFSRIEFTQNGGEKRHLTFDDPSDFGPSYEPVMELLARKNCEAVVICESAGTQTEDAQTMKRCYEQFAAGASAEAARR